MTNYKELNSEFIKVSPVYTGTDGGELFSIEIKSADGVVIRVEPERALDISSLSFRGINVCYLSQIGVRKPSVFDYSETSFMDNMFFGLLTTCGLENAGPSSVDEGVFYSQHGSISYCPAENVKYFLSEDGKKAYIEGEVSDKRFDRHNFVMKRKIEYDFDEKSISVSDKVLNRGEKDRICVMYHYNFGSPFLSEECEITVPYVSARPKNKDAEAGMDSITKVFSANVDNKPQVFYLGFAEEKVHRATIENRKLRLKVTLKFNADGLPKMDLWKNLRPDKYVLSFEPCNAYPYGRHEQFLRGEAQYLDKNEEKEYFSKIILEDLQ